MPLLIGGPVFTSHCPQCCDGVLVASNEQSRSLTHFLPQSVGVSGWFSRGFLSHMGRLYGWGDFPISLLGGGPQSWLSCPLISLALESIEIACGVSLWSTCFRPPQREFLCSTALEINQMVVSSQLVSKSCVPYTHHVRILCLARQAV